MTKHFEFGRNWRDYSSDINDIRITIAEESLKEMLGANDISGKTFLDIGCGSGLFSLAAIRLGAKNVFSFDYDDQSVACTFELKNRYFPNETNWIISQGSILDKKFLSTLGQFDIVYSWGVLHHTGNMWQSLKNVCSLIKPNGKLFIAIYNDQGRKSRQWKIIKQIYNSLSDGFKFLILIPVFIRLWLPTVIRDFFYLRPFSTWKNYKKNRGMSPWRDVVDWVGGWPFEVAKPELIFEFFRKRGFVLEKLKTCDGYGCNEFVFTKNEK